MSRQPPRPRVVLQGFERFGPYERNPSAQIVRALGQAPPSGCELATSVLASDLNAVRTGVPELIQQVRPRVWLGVGLWGGHPSVSVERYAANRIDFHIADVAGAQPRDEQIDPGGADGCFVPVDDREIVRAWADAGIPGYSSESAGAHLCNFSLYLAIKAMDRLSPDHRTTFIHVPLTPDLVRDPQTQPSMSLQTQIEAVRLAISVCVAQTGA